LASEPLKVCLKRTGGKDGTNIRLLEKLYGRLSETTSTRSMLDNIDESEVSLWTPYGIPDLPTWYKGRVLLIGDAAHALPPNGQGTAMAFEDAAVLARMIEAEGKEGKGYDKVFKHFETVRMKRLEQVKAVSRKRKGSGAPTPWTWWARQWMTWAFFAKNRWVIKDNRLSGYDIEKEDILVK
jgi:2-polyprenyl-6-methoxyphenol hydroxylase-like FAD-dependent oxidoreductase